MSYLTGQTVLTKTSIHNIVESGIIGKVLRGDFSSSNYLIDLPYHEAPLLLHRKYLKPIPEGPMTQAVTVFGFKTTIFVYEYPFEYVWKKHLAFTNSMSSGVVVVAHFGFHLTPNEVKLCPSYRDLYHHPIVLQSLYSFDQFALLRDIRTLIRQEVTSHVYEQTESLQQVI